MHSVFVDTRVRVKPHSAAEGQEGPSGFDGEVKRRNAVLRTALLQSKADSQRESGQERAGF